jgi:hypothetical protein
MPPEASGACMAKGEFFMTSVRPHLCAATTAHSPPKPIGPSSLARSPDGKGDLRRGD